MLYTLKEVNWTSISQERWGPLFAGALRQGVILNEEFSHKIV